MKKLFAFLLALTMLFSLAACGGNGGSSSQPQQDAPKPTAAPSTDDKDNSSITEGTGQEYVSSEGDEVELGLFDVNYDYSKNPRYKIQYVTVATSALTESFDACIGDWCEQMNMEYLGLREFGGDKDAYLSALPAIAETVDGLIIDPEPQMFDKVAEVLEAAGCPWMPGMSEPRNYASGNYELIHPFVGFNDAQLGSIFPAKLLAMKDELWPDVPLSEFGFISVDFSFAPTLHAREQACYNALMELAPEMKDRYFVADTAINIFDIETSSQVVSAVMAQNPDIEYWLVFAEFDDMAKGAAAAADIMGLTDTTCIAAFGGSALLGQWDAGTQDAWRSACYLPTSMYTEPVVGALYAFMNGDATPDTIFSDWVNANDHGLDGHTYAARLLPYYWIEYDNYKEIVKWGDIYAGTNYYADYPAGDLTRDSYSTKVAVPESYKPAGGK